MEKKRILLVCSDETLSSDIHKQLKGLDAKINHVSNGEEALLSLDEETFDVVLTTAHMGSVDSWQLVRFVRSKSYQDMDLPVLLVSDSANELMLRSLAQDFSFNGIIPRGKNDRLPSLVAECLADAESGRGKKRVLVVEDHVPTAEFVRKTLSVRYDVEVAHDGDSGLELWRKHQHDIVFLDMMLPGLSGASVLTLIKQDKSDQDIIMMTAHDSGEVAKTLISAGATDFLSKPVSADDLRKACDLAIRKSDYHTWSKRLPS